MISSLSAMTSTPTMWFASAAVCILLPSSLILWQKICKSPPSWIRELETLGVPRKKKLPGTAVVCGGSIAGLVTARVLADHFEKIILVDPEIDSDKPKTRIMQYYAAHVFLSLFVASARRLWPNFDAELQAAGGRIVPADTQVHYSGVELGTPYKDYPAGCLPDTLVMRRSSAQIALQRLFMQHTTTANVTILAGTVRGIETSSDKAVETVIVRERDGTHVSLNDIALVADCTGTTQAGLKWLESAGFSLPENIRYSYNGNLRYATLTFIVSPELEATLPLPDLVKNTILVYGFVSHLESGPTTFALVKTDNNTMQLLVGNNGDGDLPRLASEVVPFLSNFRGKAPIPSWVVETIRILCENCSPSFDNIKIPTQSYVRYHMVPAGALPSNFIAIGDAKLQLNPIHGQGFTKIVLNGITLNSLLNTVDPRSNNLPRDFAARYFKNDAVNTEGLWDATRLHDYGYSTCEPMKGETNDTGGLVRWFELKLISAATQDDEVASALWHVRHLLAADRALLAPTVLWKILWTRPRF
ncbi:hypothetical protein DFH07DRAFT_368825 [Mycena maculata]|uniref:FAD/NAD(P)-binding domain-containing protein n=1 Tax=Mycena maculata TaxID=230809 RepID=A0AAD7MG92_9AGAR|nr:hypothetical protein DFH07DRAFT_368825 [Mycena maculata]